tara:strand:+ start:668 stop:889 length:222 start_codon:yes stop_codon:yes gene_type:complete
MALTLDLNVTAPRAHTASGVPSGGGAPDLTLLTEAGDFIFTEAGAYLRYDVPPLLTTEADENLNTEDNISIST